MENSISVVVKGVISCNNRVLIVQRSTDDEIGPNTWECVGGKIGFGENLKDALLREVREEVGLSVTVDRLLYAATFRIGEHQQFVVLVYFCTACDEMVTLSAEHQNYLWAGREQMIDLLPKNIVDDFDRNSVWEYLFA